MMLRRLDRGQTPETQAAITSLLRDHAVLREPGLLAEAAAPVELAFGLG